MTTPMPAEFKLNSEKALRGSNHAAETESRNKEVKKERNDGFGYDSVHSSGLHWVAMNEQLAALLASLGFVPFAEEETGLSEYNLVRNFMRQLKFLSYTSEGRIIDRAYQD